MKIEHKKRDICLFLLFIGNLKDKDHSWPYNGHSRVVYEPETSPFNISYFNKKILILKSFCGRVILPCFDKVTEKKPN